MAKDALETLKIHKDEADTILQVNRQEDAQKFLDTWRLNNLGTKKSGVLPPVDAVPPHLRGIIFKRASIDNLKIAQADEQTPEEGVAPGAHGEWLDPNVKMKIMQMQEEELKKRQNKKNRKK